MKSLYPMLFSLCVAAVLLVVWIIGPQVHAQHVASAEVAAGTDVVIEDFERLDPTTPDPNGNTVGRNCGGDFLDASAVVKISTAMGQSHVQIAINNARPETLYTVWLRLKGTDPQGNSFGGSPLTGGGSTPLAPSTLVPELLAATGEGNGTPVIANGVKTDGQGNGVLTVDLDFPIFNGAYPFQNLTNFDPTDPRLPLENPQIYPVAIVIPNAMIDAPFGLRVVSHCTDNLGHGLTPGAREPWFDWPDESAPNPQEPPVAVADTYVTTQRKPLVVDAPGVLGNDRDGNNDPLTALLMSGPSGGQVTLFSDGSFNYTPNPGFNGADSFTYKVSDGMATSPPVAVTIMVNPVTIVNDLLTLDAQETSFDPTPQLPHAPAGVFTIQATFTNQGAAPIVNPFFDVTTLTRGNLLLNADSGPGDIGATLTLPPPADLLVPSEQMTVRFAIGLQRRQPFDFWVDAMGAVNDVQPARRALVKTSFNFSTIDLAQFGSDSLDEHGFDIFLPTVAR